MKFAVKQTMSRHDHRLEERAPKDVADIACLYALSRDVRPGDDRSRAKHEEPKHEIA